MAILGGLRACSSCRTTSQGAPISLRRSEQNRSVQGPMRRSLRRLNSSISSYRKRIPAEMDGPPRSLKQTVGMR